MKAFISVLLVSCCVLLIVSGMFALDLFQRRNLVVPRTVLGDIYLGGMTRDEVREVLRARLSQFITTPFSLAARGQVASVTLNDFKIVINEADIMEQIPFAGELSNAEIALLSIAGQRIAAKIPVARTEVLRVIEEKFPTIPRATNAHFELVGKKMTITEATSGVTPMMEPLLEKLSANVAFLEHTPLFVEFKTLSPSVMAADLAEVQSVVLAAFPKTFQLIFEKQKWIVDFAKHPEWILIDRKNYAVAEGELPFTLQWDPVAFSQFLSKTIASTLEQAPENVRMWSDGSEKVQFDGRGTPGRAIERERLLTLANMAIGERGTEVVVPLAVVSPKVEVSEDLQAIGVHELLGTGYTTFSGSPRNRQHNIGVAIKQFNGTIIQPGEVFSFDKNLGLVDGSTGYLKELVIKPEGVIPEYGGGVCQVSSTMYRAALYAGLPIVVRSPHSFAVSYYAQVSGHGLDATVYPPTVDLKFKNDTLGAIVVQSYVDGVAAYFKFYGTNDGRSVRMEGPFISNRVAAIAEPRLVPDSSLAPGKKRHVEHAHAGFDVTWYRYLTRSGETVQEKIFSRYRATQDKFLVGGDVEPEKSVEAAPSANPFE